MGRPERHVFVCVQRRPERGRSSCAQRGGEQVLAALAEAVTARPHLIGVAVTGCSCLGPCFEGPNLVVYPDRVWYAGVAVTDVDEIADQHLGLGRPVERLLSRFVDEDS
jgi:(2Fe-2S) ferredoxin